MIIHKIIYQQKHVQCSRVILGRRPKYLRR